MEDIRWHTYNGLAGDPHWLLVGTFRGDKYYTLFRRGSLWSLRRARRRVRREIELVTGGSV